MTDEPTEVVVERPEVTVMFKRVADDVAAINCGWQPQPPGLMHSDPARIPQST